MSSQQRAAMAHAAFINFFGDSGTMSSILQTVQPTQPQTSTEQSHQLTNDLQVMVSDNQQGMSLHTSTEHQSSYNNPQNTPYTIPHISHSRRSSTDTNPTSSSPITQQDYNRQSYRVPHCYSNSHSYSDRRRVRRQNTHRHHSDRKHTKKDDRQ